MTNKVAMATVNNAQAMWLAIISVVVSVVMIVVFYIHINTADMEPEPKGGFGPKQRRHSNVMLALLFSAVFVLVFGISPYIDSTRAVDAAAVEKAYGISDVSFNYGNWYEFSHRTVSAKEWSNRGGQQIWHTIRFRDRYGTQVGMMKMSDGVFYLYTIDEYHPGYMEPYDAIRDKSKPFDSDGDDDDNGGRPMEIPSSFSFRDTPDAGGVRSVV